MVLGRLGKRLLQHWVRVGLVLTVVFTLGTLATLPASASPTKAAGGADLSFYKGKTITLIAPASTGDFIDLISRLMAQYMGKYLHATVNVEDVPGSGQIIGVNRGYASRADGMTMTDLDMGALISDQIEGYPGMHFSLAKWDYLGNIKTPTESALITHPKSPITFDALMKKGAPKFKVLDVRSGVNDATERILYGAFGIPVQFITAFSSQGPLFQAFEAGQGDLAYNAWDGLAGEAVQAGKAKAILSVNIGTSVRFPGVPNYTTEISKYKSRISKQGLAALNALPSLESLGSGVLGVPPGTPSARVAALTQAMNWTVKQPAFVQQAAKEKILDPSFQPPAQVKSLANATLNNKALAQFLGKYTAS